MVRRVRVLEEGEIPESTEAAGGGSFLCQTWDFGGKKRWPDSGPDLQALRHAAHIMPKEYVLKVLFAHLQKFIAGFVWILFILSYKGYCQVFRRILKRQKMWSKRLLVSSSGCCGRMWVVFLHDTSLQVVERLPCSSPSSISFFDGRFGYQLQ